MGFFLPSSFVFAAGGTCVCYSAQNDCQAAFLPLSDQSPAACTNVCTSLLKTQMNGANYAEDTAGEVLNFSCTQTHKDYLAALAAKTASPATGGSTSPLKESITPTLNVAIPGLTFSKATVTATSVKSSFLADYLTAVYQFLIGASITIAIVMVMIGGLQYAMAASGGDVSKGKTRIMNALTGLVLLLGVYLILYTTNPKLTLLKSIQLENVQEADMPEEDAGDVVPDGETPPTSAGLPAPKRLCHSIDECKKICDDKSLIAQYNVTVPVLKDAPGFKNSGRAKGTAELQAALVNAGKIALTYNPNYTIRIVGGESGYRSVTAQVNKACDDIKNNGGNSLTHGILAWPGGSNHGSGVAADVQLFDSGTDLMTLSAKAQSDPRYKDPADALGKIMNQAGFVRYGKEIWHFELKGSAGSFCRCSYPSCPFPPHC
ncbi:MAG: M15 family metallopeptidase [Candidatus Uhrbacteria bacterium]|nr:M15 family metallopeptidase [Candidatus Uhrbacteria bacterium]